MRSLGDEGPLLISYIPGNNCPQGRGPKYLIPLVISREVSYFNKNYPHPAVDQGKPCRGKYGQGIEKEAEPGPVPEPSQTVICGLGSLLGALPLG